MADPKSSAGPSSPAKAITNVFVLMLENHSFDNIFAMSGISEIRAATVQDWNEYEGKKYFVRDGAPPSMSTDPGHEFDDVLTQLSFNNSGFAWSYATSLSEDTGKPDPSRIGDIMACFHTETQLPVIYTLAREFALCDQWFSSIPGPTWPNRFFVHGASSAGWADSPVLQDEIGWELDGFRYANGSIFDALQNAGHQWRVYNDAGNRYSDDPSGFLFGGWISQVASLKGVSQLDVDSLDHFAADLNRLTAASAPAYTYPYTFIEPNFGKSFFAPQPPAKGPTYKGGSSQHPEDDPSGGEGLIKAVYEAIRNSPIWDTSLLIVVYDEHGGFYDSVPPGRAPSPGDEIPEGQTTRNASGFDFSHYGVRVPAVVVSPLIPRGTVDHTPYDHSSILATLERLLSMKPLTNRDAQANDVLHLLTATVRDDCPLKLPDPVRYRERSSPPTTDPSEAMLDLPLRNSGNMIGFLHILLKTELELAGGDAATRAEIQKLYKTITTTGSAAALAKRLWAKIEAAKQTGKART